MLREKLEKILYLASRAIVISGFIQELICANLEIASPTALHGVAPAPRPPLHVSGLHLVSPLPDLAEADRRVEPVKNGQRHRNVRDDRPRPQPIKVQLYRVRFRPRLLQGVYGPHRQVGHQKEGDDLSSGLLSDLVRRHAAASGSVQHEDGLAGGLQEGSQGRSQHQNRVLLDGELSADDREGAVDEHPRLGADQQDVVQLQVPASVVLQLAHLPHSDQGGEGGEPVEGQFADVNFDDGEADELRPRDEDEEEDQGDDGEHQEEDSNEEALVGLSAIDGVVVGASFEGVELAFLSVVVVAARREFGNVPPHHVQNCGAN